MPELGAGATFCRLFAMNYCSVIRRFNKQWDDLCNWLQYFEGIAPVRGRGAGQSWQGLASSPFRKNKTQNCNGGLIYCQRSGQQLDLCQSCIRGKTLEASLPTKIMHIFWVTKWQNHFWVFPVFTIPFPNCKEGLKDGSFLLWLSSSMMGPVK